MWVLRDKGEEISSESWVVSAGRNDGVSVGGDLEDFPRHSSWVGEVLRRDVNGSTSQDRQLLWRFLRESCSAENGGRSPEWFDADEVLTWLRGAPGEAAEIEAGLMHLSLDQSLSGSLRCLALRHLGMWAEEHPLGEETVVQLRAATGARMESGVGAAALCVLHRMRPSSGNKDWLRARILELLEDGNCPPEQRVAAFQIAVELNAAEVEPVARKFVAPSRAVAERVSAFLALGRLGNRETLQWLRVQPLPIEVLVLEARERALLNLANR